MEFCSLATEAKQGVDKDILVCIHDEPDLDEHPKFGRIAREAPDAWKRHDLG